jgi:predicted methyltransferase
MSRDKWRHPAETIAFFGICPTDFVMEGGPSAGWYTDILAPYVGREGRYGAVSYEYNMYEAILADPSPERLEEIKNWPTTFPRKIASKHEFAVDPIAFTFRQAPQDIAGEVDVVLMIREMHNYYRVEGENDFLDQTLRDIYSMLKPGGVFGVVQHRAPEDAQGPAASGAYGYLKQSAMIAAIENAGFVLEATSEVNANPADGDREAFADENIVGIVWRLPPRLYYEDRRREEFLSIGESDRMTLRFRKPEE